LGVAGTVVEDIVEPVDLVHAVTFKVLDADILVAENGLCFDLTITVLGQLRHSDIP
jgi:hypothetical protein